MKPEYQKHVVNLLTLLFLAGLLALGRYLKQPEEGENPAGRHAASSQIVEVSLTGKKNRDALYGQQFVDLDFSYKNNGSKDIASIKGVMHIANRYDQTILDLMWEFDGGVPANKTVVVNGSAIAVNTDMPDYGRLWKTDFDGIKSNFVVSEVTFKDGSKVKAPGNRQVH